LAEAVEAAEIHPDRVIASLVRLVAVDESGRRSRRRIRLADLPGPERTALGVFVDRRLLVSDTDDGQVWISLAHDALTRCQLLDDAVRRRTVYFNKIQSVEKAAAEWAKAGRDEVHLWSKQRLAAAGDALGMPDILAGPPVESLPNFPPELVAEPREFLDASVRQAQTADQRSRRIRNRIIAGLSVLLALALAATAIAGWQQQSARNAQRVAEQQHQLAVGRELLGQAAILRDRQPRVALSLTIAAFEFAPDLTEARDALLSAQATYYGATLKPQTGALHAVAFRPDGGQLAAAGHADALTVWEMPSRRTRRISTSAPMTSVAFSSDNRVLAGGGRNGAVGLWDTRTFKKIKNLAGGIDAVQALAFSPDRRLLAVAQGNTVGLWDARTFVRIAVPGDGLRGGLSDVLGLAFSPDGRTLATTSGDGERSVRVWDLKTYRDRAVAGYPGPAPAVAFSADGRELATGGTNGAVNIWDAASLDSIAAVTESAEKVQAVAFSPDERMLATAGEDGSVRLLDAPSHRLLTTLTGPTKAVTGLAFSRDGRVLAGAGIDGVVGLWNVSGILGNQPEVFNAAVFGSGGKLATAGQNRTAQLWDARSGTGPVLRALLGGPTATSPAPSHGAPFGMAFDAAGTMLAVPSTDNSAALWNVGSGDLSPARRGVIQGERDRPVRAVAFSANGLLAAASAESNGDVDLWDPQAPRESRGLGRAVHAPIGGTINAVAVSSAGPGGPPSLVATGGDDGNVTIVDLSEPRAAAGGDDKDRLPAVLPREARSSPVEALAFSPDGSLLAGTSYDGTVRLWDTGGRSRETGRYNLLRTLSGWVGPVVAVSFSGDGKVLAAVGVDGVIRLWDVASPGAPSFGALRATLTGRPGTASVTFPPDGDGGMFATADQDGTPVLWETDPDRLHDSLCAGPRPAITQEDWSANVPNEPYRPICG
jgi:WD40 repeat protein